MLTTCECSIRGGRMEWANRWIDNLLCVCLCAPHRDSHNASRMADWLAGGSYPIIILRNRWQKWASRNCCHSIGFMGDYNLLVGFANNYFTNYRPSRTINYSVSLSVAFDNKDILDRSNDLLRLMLFLFGIMYLWDVEDKNEMSHTEYPCK